jgi:hypothetical protein
MTNELIQVNVTPKARAMWATLGTEYTKSFLALKEMIDNSISAANGKGCKVIISLQDIGDMVYKISIEDNSGGVQDPSVLLTIATECNTKAGKHNYYGYGFKNAMAFFQPKWEMTQWIVQSKTHDNIENDLILEVKAPYVYNDEYNEEFGHNGMNIKMSEISNYRGEFNTPSTYIEFTTNKNRFNNLHPLKGGRPIESVQKIAEELGNLISFYYRPLLMNNELAVDVKYCVNDGKRNFKNIKVTAYDLPILESLYQFETNKKTQNGAIMKVKARWFKIDRDCDSVYEFPQCRGLLLYINGILVEPYKWVDNVFGGNTFHPSMNSLVCYVEVESVKSATPELSVSKTKIQESGENYQTLITLLNSECPNKSLDYIKNAANTTNEIVRRDRRFNTQLRDQASNGYICDLEKERLLQQPNGKKGNESLKVDIFYKKAGTNKLVIEEFKKDKINSSSIGQVLVYLHLLQMEFPTHEIELILVSGECQETAKLLIQSLSSTKNIKVSFKSFNELGLA